MFLLGSCRGRFERKSMSEITYPIGDKTMDEMCEIIKKEVASGE